MAGVVAMHESEGLAQPIAIARHRDDVDVVGHEAIGPYFHPEPPRRIGHQIEIQRIVALLEKGLLTPIAALGDVARDAGETLSGEASHGVLFPLGPDESIWGLTHLSP